MGAILLLLNLAIYPVGVVEYWNTGILGFFTHYSNTP